ncbi:MAG: type I glyceraldehyde-3-phosphate dehydrogenase [Candidatus Gracilibacteria bacterium]|nr:type I glyceraldehyde-3-phosphate dehydrogenase [Candidatus Gracilibacteria bacterium]MDQ7022336.1 type I glyceraldehyde-3-phosphate dehydrogenase [Candidatus Gracilibacteria bacterium]
MKVKKTKIAINGYGRIGICVAKIISKRDDCELVAINSSTPHSEIEYLTKYDSVHGNNSEEVKVKNGYLYIGKRVKAKILSERNIEVLDFGKEGAEIVLDCTGAFLTTEKAKSYLKNGVKKVIMSAPAKDDTPTFVIGVNEKDYNGEKIISNASCTTNGMGALTKVINQEFGIEKAIMTTIHSYTASQNLLDAKNPKDRRKGRSGSLNMIPTSTGAAKAITKIMPELIGKIHGQAVRVPTPNVSLIDINFVLNKNTSKEEINEFLENLSIGDYKGLIEIDNEMKVSSDFIGNSSSCIIAPDMTQVVGGNLLKIMAWYDNEWGYSNRLVDMVVLIGK